ncbi:MAG: hypothetical protein MJY71_02415 [Bacteroidaceae bacterium]|nr:hypothetical protein [Bacteroidaceae bacterium]
MRQQDIQQVIGQIYRQAKQLDACDKFRGTETYEELVRLFLSPQGIEFCLANHFPNTATFRLFKALKPEQSGIHIDAGAITLTNPTDVVLIGHTSATINCNTHGRHSIVLLHGARAIINASGWAVVRVRQEEGCICIKSTSDNAIIL